MEAGSPVRLTDDGGEESTSLVTRRSILIGGAALGSAAVVGCDGGRALDSSPAVVLPARDAIASSHLPAPSPELHLLKRASWGATRASLAELQSIGMSAWLERQLDPATIDDSEVEREVAERWTSLNQSACQLDQQQDETRIMRELRQATLFRRVFSRRQLYEVMVDFWTDHFNLLHGDGLIRHNKTADDRDVIRPHALGSFRDLLHASARSPSMLHYLDNRVSTEKKPNENYARELLELHTLGVDGGYTETDVKEVARAFTGWTVAFDKNDSLCLNGTHNTFVVSNRHDRKAKRVLGQNLPADRGIEDGNQVLNILVDHPATQRHIAFKLCRRLVADAPPDALVARVAARWGEDGDIKAMLREIFGSSEFSAASDAKLTRPQEFAVGMVRALDPEIDSDTSLHDLLRTSGLVDLVNGMALNRRDNIDSIEIESLPDVGLSDSYEGPNAAGVLSTTGHVPFQWPAPDGYPDVETYWASADGLLERWKFAIAVAKQQREGQSNADFLSESAASPADICDALSQRLLFRPLLETDRLEIVALAAGDQPSDQPLPEPARQAAAQQVMAMLLVSPYMQRR